VAVEKKPRVLLHHGEEQWFTPTLYLDAGTAGADYE
jgi:hypothetical protein